MNYSHIRVTGGAVELWGDEGGRDFGPVTRLSKEQAERLMADLERELRPEQYRRSRAAKNQLIDLLRDVRVEE